MSFTEGILIPDFDSVKRIAANEAKNVRTLALSAGVFISGNTDLPRVPTAAELTAYGTTPIKGSRLNAERKIQPLLWSGGAWINDGAAIATGLSDLYALSGRTIVASANQTIVLGVGEVGLTVPAGFNRGKVTVTVGSARMGLNSAATAPVYAVNEGVDEIADAQLTAFRILRSGAEGTVFVEYWKLA